MKAKRSKEETINEIKATVLRYFSTEDRFLVVRSGDGRGFNVIEEGRGVVAFWDWRQAEWMQALVTKKEIEDAREKYKADGEEMALEYYRAFTPGARVALKGSKRNEELIVLQLTGMYNRKCKVEIQKKEITEEGKIETWKETAIVWTSDLILVL